MHLFWSLPWPCLTISLIGWIMPLDSIVQLKKEPYSRNKSQNLLKLIQSWKSQQRGAKTHLRSGSVPRGFNFVKEEDMDDEEGSGGVVDGAHMGEAAPPQRTPEELDTTQSPKSLPSDLLGRRRDSQADSLPTTQLPLKAMGLPRPETQSLPTAKFQTPTSSNTTTTTTTTTTNTTSNSLSTMTGNTSNTAPASPQSPYQVKSSISPIKSILRKPVGVLSLSTFPNVMNGTLNSITAPCWTCWFVACICAFVLLFIRMRNEIWLTWEALGTWCAWCSPLIVRMLLCPHFPFSDLLNAHTPTTGMHLLLSILPQAWRLQTRCPTCNLALPRLCLNLDSKINFQFKQDWIWLLQKTRVPCDLVHWQKHVNTN